MTGTSRTGSASGTSSAAEPVPLPRGKRALDIAVSGTLLVAATPVAAVALGAIGLDMLWRRQDRGRLLYRERRISRGRPFDLLKFRTLREPVLAEAAGHVRPYEADPANLTWAGRRLLKPMYLDELPQVVNVLVGEMSLVGPRPWPPELVERQLARGVDYRLAATAGWTGPAQVTKGRESSYEDLDRAYVELLRTATGWQVVRHDLRILRRTVATLLRGEGLAY